MYPDEIGAAEAVLRVYPDALMELSEREEFLQGVCSGGGPGDDVRVDGGSSVPSGERYAAAVEADARLQCARRIITAVQAGLATLNRNEDRVVRKVFFERLKPVDAAASLELSPSYTRSLVDSARSKSAPFCIPAYPSACELRRVRENERRARLKALSEDGGIRN